MTHFKVTLTKREVYYVESDSHDAAVEKAVSLDTDREESWSKKQYYDEMESEELD